MAVPLDNLWSVKPSHSILERRAQGQPLHKHKASSDISHRGRILWNRLGKKLELQRLRMCVEDIAMQRRLSLEICCRRPKDLLLNTR